MFAYLPEGATVLLLADNRTLGDMRADQHIPKPYGSHTVLEKWGPGVNVWGSKWKHVARIALFEFGQDVEHLRPHTAQNLSKFFRYRPFEYIIVLESRSKAARRVWDDEFATSDHIGTVCWRYFHPPASIRDMGGTFWEKRVAGADTIVVPMPNHQNNDYVYRVAYKRWLRAIRNKRPIFKPDPVHTRQEGQPVGPFLVRLLESAWNGLPIALDIESVSSWDLISVIGLSDGETTVAVPWEPFVPRGCTRTEPGYCDAPEGQVVRQILACASEVFVHNGIRFDLPFLARKGVSVWGTALDSYLAHGILLNQFRHGLQQAVSYEFVTPPWKSIQKQSMAKRGDDPDDPESYSTAPAELRAYCAKDVYYTYWLATALKRHGGITT